MFNKKTLQPKDDQGEDFVNGDKDDFVSESKDDHVDDKITDRSEDDIVDNDFVNEDDDRLLNEDNDGFVEGDKQNDGGLSADQSDPSKTRSVSEVTKQENVNLFNSKQKDGEFEGQNQAKTSNIVSVQKSLFGIFNNPRQKQTEVLFKEPYKDLPPLENSFEKSHPLFGQQILFKPSCEPRNIFGKPKPSQTTQTKINGNIFFAKVEVGKSFAQLPPGRQAVVSPKLITQQTFNSFIQNKSRQKQRNLFSARTPQPQSKESIGKTQQASSQAGDQRKKQVPNLVPKLPTLSQGEILFGKQQQAPQQKRELISASGDQHQLQKIKLSDLFQSQKEKSNSIDPTQQGELFGVAQPKKKQELNSFGVQSAQQQGGGFFSGSQPQQPTPLFGGSQPQKELGGLFGGSQTQKLTPLFGGSQTQKLTPLFGGSQPQQPTPLFGGSQTQKLTPLFGGSQPQQPTPLFGGSQPQQPTPLFGGNLPQQPTPLFGGNLPQNRLGGLFGGHQQPQQSTGVVFGQHNQPGTIINIFTGSIPQTSPVWGTRPQQHASIFGTSPQNQNSIWGTQPQQQASNWGTQPGSNLFAKQQTNQFGGTSWGVSTSTNQSSSYLVKSRNLKIDNKHMIKCISALQQYTNMTKEQLRVHYLTSGIIPNAGSSTQKMSETMTAKLQTQTPSTDFGGSIFGPRRNTSFNTQQLGQKQQSSNIFGGSQPAQTGSVFGAQIQPQQGESLFGGQQLTQGGNIFINQQPLKPQQTSQFSETQPNQRDKSLFSQKLSQQGSLLSVQPQIIGRSLSVATQNQQQHASLLGSTQLQASSSLVGKRHQNTGELRSTSQQNTEGLVFRGQNQEKSLFGRSQHQGQSQRNGPSGNIGPDLAQQQQQNIYGFMQDISASTGNLNMKITIPLRSTNNANMDPNYNKSMNDILTMISLALMQGGAISVVDTDKLSNKTQKSNQKQYKQQLPLKDIPSTFDYSMNQKKLQTSECNFEMKKLHNYLEKEKEKDENERKKFSVLQGVKSRKEISVLTSPREDINNASKISKSKYASVGQLPETSEYILKPSLLRLSKMTAFNLREVYDVEIIGDYGSIKFLQPISLIYKEIDSCVEIKQDKIDINQPSWKGKKCELSFFNFVQYNEKSEKEKHKIEDQIFKWIQMNQNDNMELVHWDQDEGTLVVTIH